MKRWIRISGAGEFRGEGSWVEVSGDLMERDFENCKKTGFMPTAWEVPDAEIDLNTDGKMMQFVVRDKTVVNQFHRIATPLLGAGDGPRHYAIKQIKHLLDSKLIIDGEPA